MKIKQVEEIKKEFYKEFCFGGHNYTDKLWTWIEQALSSQQERLIGEIREKIEEKITDLGRITGKPKGYYLALGDVLAIIEGVEVTPDKQAVDAELKATKYHLEDMRKVAKNQ
jgi:hypothetical protein